MEALSLSLGRFESKKWEALRQKKVGRRDHKKREGLSQEKKKKKMGKTESKSAIDTSLLSCLLRKKFPEYLKLADVSFNFERKDKTLAENCTLNAPPTVLKTFKRTMEKQMSDQISSISRY